MGILLRDHHDGRHGIPAYVLHKHLAGKHNQQSHAARTFKGPEDSKAFMDSTYGEWKQNLTPAQEKGLAFYHSPGYQLMNGELRGQKVDAPEADLKRARQATKDLKSAIDKAPPLEEGIIVHRGFSADQFDLTPGSTITDQGFVSTSTFKAGAASFQGTGPQVQAKIFLPPGTKAAAGSFKELTLPPGSTFRVVSRKGANVELELVLGE